MIEPDSILPLGGKQFPLAYISLRAQGTTSTQDLDSQTLKISTDAFSHLYIRSALGGI
jgi:hypothetical protein